MIGRILGVLGFSIIILMLVYWVVRGGPSKAVTAAKTQPSVVEGLLNGDLFGKTLSLKLPWQASVSGPGYVDISQYVGADADKITVSGYSKEQLDHAKNFGLPSPYRSQVSLQQGHATESDPSKEYLSIKASRDNEGTISITGWSVQNAVSGERYYLPEAAPEFIGGAVNSLGPISLAPGGSAIISSGVSPVGVSFRENRCSGYLGKLQTFYPSMGFASCPNPSDALTETVENLRTYGSSCLDYVHSLSSCEFPQDVPVSLSPACRSFVTNTFSYNGCVQMYRSTESFHRNAWRLYLNAQHGIWDDRHDIVRLLDAAGRTVDAVTY